MSDRKDVFKYWSSYRTEAGIERGIANQQSNGKFYIDDAAPYVVYKTPVPANRIVVKMQTNVGSITLGQFQNFSGIYGDPFFGYENQTTPVRWKIQYLENNSWVDAKSFDESSERRDGSPVIGPDGYVELSYGLVIPKNYLSVFSFEKVLTSIDLLPDPQDLPNGTSFIVRQNSNGLGTVHIVVDNVYETYPEKYGWELYDEEVSKNLGYVRSMVNPPSFNGNVSETRYREFQYISGLRIVAETMNKYDAILDLIELSPRLAADITDKTENYSVTKPASDLGVSGLPVGQLLASVGSIQIFDYDQAFFPENNDSILKDYISQSFQIKFYESIVDNTGFEHFVPIKTMYADEFPQINNAKRSVSIQLRDLFFYFESLDSPQLFLQNVSFSYAVSILLDYIGFSSYTFKRVDDESEDVIPFFFVEPDTTIANVLNALAVSTQTAMFFDEYNNFVSMSRQYMLPSVEDRETDIFLYGDKDYRRNSVVANELTGEDGKLANIVQISSQENTIYNDGKIVYSVRDIQKNTRSIEEQSYLEKDRNYTYVPATLWEVSGSENTRSTNQEIGIGASYTLTAIPLNSDLSKTLPSVSNYKVINNTMDLGDSIYWITRYNGYFYANGEIIKYDAVQFSVPGLSANEESDDGDNVWITSIKEYQRYFSKIPFNGKMYPTGLVRIYSEPNYETVEGIARLRNGDVAKHGRGQFGTSVVEHKAGVDPDWLSDEYVRGIDMQSDLLFVEQETIPETETGPAGVSYEKGRETSRSGFIINALSKEYKPEKIESQSLPATVQSSALVMSGPGNSVETPRDIVAYVYKELPENRFVHFGTRMRVVGKLEDSDLRTQSSSGATVYYNQQDARSDESVTISGGSGGIGVFVNPQTNNGYFFEIMALSDFTSQNGDLMFYKVEKEVGAKDSDKAVPTLLWSGNASVLADDGTFVGQSRFINDEVTTVYDIGVEYEVLASGIRFYLYVNDTIVGIVDDKSPLPVYNNLALFVRGASKCMFENVYALSENYSQNAVSIIDVPVNQIFGAQEINSSNSFRKYSLSGIVQSSYLSGIGSVEPPKYNIYYEEFGTIMREAAYFDVRYDLAYPALLAQLSPTTNRIKGYSVSGFFAGPYGAEFLVFNNTDTVLELGADSGNYLKIQGVTFTQQNVNELTVDDFYEKRSNLSDPQFVGENLAYSPFTIKRDYEDIKISRLTQGRKEFTIDAAYIQTQDSANDLMGWLSSKIMKKRKSVGVEIFANPMIQLGDVVQIKYANDSGVEEISSEDTRYVVYHIEYEKSNDGPTMQIYLSEVPSD
jgi:hypothetical protein